MRRIAFFTLLSYWRRHLFQLSMLIVGLALATALWLAVQALNAQARASYAQAQAFLAPPTQTSIEARFGTLTVADYVALKRQGWKLSPVLVGRWRSVGQSLELMGIDVLTSPRLRDISNEFSSQGEQGTLLALLQPPGSLLMHPDTAKAFGTREETSRGSLAILTSETVPPGYAITDIALASQLLGQPDHLTRMIVLEDPGFTPQRQGQLPEGLQLVETDTSSLDPGGLTESFHLNLTAFGFLAFAVGLFIVQGMITLAMEQRRGVLRTLRCLGLPFPSLIGLLALEMILIAFVSACIGLVIGYFIAMALLPNVSATLDDLYDSRISDQLTLHPAWVLSGFGISLLGTALASAHSFWVLWKLPILQLPSTQARGQQVSGAYGRLALAGQGLLGLGLLALFFYGGLVGGFIFLAGLLLGAALALPFLLWYLLQLGQSLSRGPLAQWLWADARAQLPGLSLALMALMLALATNIGVGTMVSSFRLTFEDWMDQRLSAELYVTAKDDNQGAELQEWLDHRQVTALPIRSHVLNRPTGRIRIYGVKDDLTYRQNWPMLQAQAEVWSLVAAGAGLLVSEQLARREGLTLGDRLNLPPDWPAEVLGIYSDYGNPHGQAIVSLPVLLQAALEPPPNRRFGLRLPSKDVPHLINDILQEFDIQREQLVEQKVVKARSMAVFNQTFQVTDALKLLTLGVASFAIFTSLVTLWSQRLPQLGPVWAMGVSRRTLALFDILRSLLMAALTAILALPLGLVLSWVLLDVINTEAFGWRLPMYLFPMDWGFLVLLSLLAALVAALIPAWQLFRLQPYDLLKVFSSER